MTIGLAVLSASASYFILQKRKRNIFYARSYDDKFELDFNKEWSLTKKNELNPNSNLEILNASKGICIIMFSKKKSELNVTLEEYSKTITEAIKEDISNNKNIFISKKKAYLTEFDSYYKNMEIRYFIYTLETENYYHQFMAASINKDYKLRKHKSNIKLVKGILKTLREVKDD